MIGAVYPRASEGIAAALQRTDLAETTTDLSASPALIGPDAVRDLLCHAEWGHFRQLQCPPRQVSCRSKSKPEIGYLQRDLHSFLGAISEGRRQLLESYLRYCPTREDRF